MRTFKLPAGSIKHAEPVQQGKRKKPRANNPKPTGFPKISRATMAQN